MVLQHIIGMALRSQRTSSAIIMLQIYAAFFAIAGLVFLLLGAFWWLETVLPPMQAGVVIGLLLFAVSAFTSFFCLNKTKKKSKTPVHIGKELENIYQEVTEVFNEELLTQLVSNNPKTALVLSALAGFTARERLF